MQISTPCINICKLENNLCVGCFRTIDEIVNWKHYTEIERIEIIEISRKRGREA